MRVECLAGRQNGRRGIWKAQVLNVTEGKCFKGRVKVYMCNAVFFFLLLALSQEVYGAYPKSLQSLNLVCPLRHYLSAPVFF